MRLNQKLACLSRRPARGAGALIVTMVLLFASSVVVFYLNRGLLFEQKTSANQMRSTAAFEVAEAGIEWAIGMLNSPTEITTACTVTTAASSFRTKYIKTGGSSVVSVAPTTFPGCKINVDGSLTCSCPDLPGAGAEAVANTGTALLPSFTVAFSSVGDDRAVRITSTACTPQAGTCKPATTSAATTGASDAWAQVSVIVKLRPLLRAAPSAALTCGTSCAVGGSYNIRNTEVSSNGYLVNAGTSITSGNGTSYETVPGQPIENALIADDDSLLAIASTDTTCTNSAMFKTYFGQTMAEYAASDQVITIPSCTNPSTCGGLVQAAVTAGYQNFYFPDGLSLNNSAPFSTLGATGAGNGVTIVSPGDININGNISIYGMVFSNSANVNDLGTGTADIFGAMITCTGYNNNGNGTLAYDSNALNGSGLGPGLMVKVPGSWRDFTP
jgi:Tfp pilus assembly protein PilX